MYDVCVMYNVQCSAVLGDITNNYLPLPHYLHFRAQCGAALVSTSFTLKLKQTNRNWKRNWNRNKTNLTETEDRQTETEKLKQKNWNWNRNKKQRNEEKHKQKVPFRKLAQIVWYVIAS